MPNRSSETNRLQRIAKLFPFGDNGRYFGTGYFRIRVKQPIFVPSPQKFYSILFNDSIIFILLTFPLSSKFDRMVSKYARIIETNMIKIFNLSGIC